MRATAYHEAGHVVARHAFGFAPTEVSIRRDGSGLVRGGATTKRPGEIIIIALAGPVAEVLAAGARDLGTCRGDIVYAMRVLDAAYGADRADEVFELHAAAAHDIVRARWASVERVAEALLAKRRLSGRQVRALLAS